jgi:hypothetical protein
MDSFCEVAKYSFGDAWNILPHGQKSHVKTQTTLELVVHVQMVLVIYGTNLPKCFEAWKS